MKIYQCLLKLIKKFLNIFNKLDVSNIAEAVYFATANNII